MGREPHRERAVTDRPLAVLVAAPKQGAKHLAASLAMNVGVRNQAPDPRGQYDGEQCGPTGDGPDKWHGFTSFPGRYIMRNGHLSGHPSTNAVPHGIDNDASRATDVSPRCLLQVSFDSVSHVLHESQPSQPAQLKPNRAHAVF